MTELKTSEEIEVGEVFEDEKYLPAKRSISIDQIATMEPDRVAQIVQNRITALDTIRKSAIRSTNPEDWTGFKDQEGNVNYLLRSSGAQKIRPAYGISTLNVRPERPKIETIDDRTTATIMGDGHCGITGDIIENITAVRASDEHFIGRNTVEDLRQSARTLLDTKIVRILAGMIRVPEHELITCGVDVNKTNKGSGFGKSSERKADKVVDEKTKTLRDQLADKLTKYTAGDTKKAAEIIQDITKNPPKFAGFNSLKQMTQEWQVKQALEKLDILMTEGGAE